MIVSHYCRAHTNRKYLGSRLSIAKIYELYLSKCASENVSQVVRKSMYYRIFVTEYNLGFHIPKSDRCDICEKYKVAKNTETLTSKLEMEYQLHQSLNEHMREARSLVKKDKDLPVLFFDLENIILTPHADISSFFYLRKLKVSITYLLTMCLQSKYIAVYGVKTWGAFRKRYCKCFLQNSDCSKPGKRHY